MFTIIADDVGTRLPTNIRELGCSWVVHRNSIEIHSLVAVGNSQETALVRALFEACSPSATYLFWSSSFDMSEPAQSQGTILNIPATKPSPLLKSSTPSTSSSLSPKKSYRHPLSMRRSQRNCSRNLTALKIGGDSSTWLRVPVTLKR